MGLSESEIEARLAALRRRREALDREIADLVLYLELGRRLAAAGSDARQDPAPVSGRPPVPASDPASDPAGDLADAPAGRERGVPEVRSGAAAGAPSRGLGAAEPLRAARAGSRPEASGGRVPIPPAIAFTEDAAGARRYGRAVVEAAAAAIARAGRPLHASEILEDLVGQGFTLPGRDPVAALNTRLWKRAGPGGLLIRVGEATYAPASSDPERA